MELELSKKAKQNYLYCGLGAVLKYFDSQGMTTYSRALLDAFLADAQRKYLSGELKRAAWQNVRKSVLWIAEYQETGIISHCRLTDTLVEYASSDYERLIREYDSYIRADGYLKENTCYAYTPQSGNFFEGWGRLDRISTANSHCSMLQTASARRQSRSRLGFLISSLLCSPLSALLQKSTQSCRISRQL